MVIIPFLHMKYNFISSLFCLVNEWHTWTALNKSSRQQIVSAINDVETTRSEQTDSDSEKNPQ